MQVLWQENKKEKVREFMRIMPSLLGQWEKWALNLLCLI